MMTSDFRLIPISRLAREAGTAPQTAKRRLAAAGCLPVAMLATGAKAPESPLFMAADRVALVRLIQHRAERIV